MKHSFLKKFLVFILAMALCISNFALAASAETAPDSYEDRVAAYRSAIIANDVTTDDFLIGSWVTFYSFDIDSYEYQLDQMAAAGINFNIFPKNFGEGAMYDAEYWEDIEAQYAQRNMVYLMNGSMDSGLVMTGRKFASGKEHCIGYHVKDEPFAIDLGAVANQMKLYREVDPQRYPFTNLLPSYAPTSWLGGTYREYIENYVSKVGADNVGYLSHDYYPFAADGSVRTGIFADMEVIRSVAYENGKLKTHAFPQSTGWANARMPNINEMRWNVYGYLAYGFKALSWFNLVCPGNADNEGEGFYNSIIYRDGTIRDQELFDAWSELNWEVRGMSSILMSVDVSHAYHVVNNVGGVEYLPEDYFLQPNDKVANDFVISVMESKQGNDQYIMLFNKDMTADTTLCSFKIDEAAKIEKIECFDPLTGEYEEVNISSGYLKDTFAPGEGKIYRLNYAENEEQAPEETPGDKPADTPVEKPEENPEETPEEAPENIPSNTPDENAPEGTDSETAKDDKTEDNTDKEKSNKKGGCFSVVGAASAAVWATTLVGATLIFKRKKR